MGNEKTVCEVCYAEVMSDDLFDCEQCGVSLCDNCQHVVERANHEDKVLCQECFIAECDRDY